MKRIVCNIHVKLSFDYSVHSKIQERKGVSVAYIEFPYLIYNISYDTKTTEYIIPYFTALPIDVYLQRQSA